jgi:hypothetical protein
MGFSVHPGPLPLITVRRQQWECRLTIGELIEIHGEHGCDMPAMPARVVAIRPITHAEAARAGLHVPAVYAGMSNLQAIELQAPDLNTHSARSTLRPAG